MKTFLLTGDLIKMKVVRLIGGLGNQMFQYALFLSLKNVFPAEDVYVDKTLYKSYRFHNGLELERAFSIDLPQAPVPELRKLCWYSSHYRISNLLRRLLPARKTECYEPADHSFDETVLTREGSRVFFGYWQCGRYFDRVSEEVKTAFRFAGIEDPQNIEMSRMIENTPESVSLHVRRRDYLKSGLYAGLCGLDYYGKAIGHICEKRSNPHFFIFSDDIAFCRECIVPLLKNNTVTFVDHNTGTSSFRDMQLMSLCRDNIIANRSFSWWGAYLNAHADKIVCAPEKWVNLPLKYRVQQPEWILF